MLIIIFYISEGLYKEALAQRYLSQDFRNTKVMGFHNLRYMKRVEKLEYLDFYQTNNISSIDSFFVSFLLCT